MMEPVALCGIPGVSSTITALDAIHNYAHHITYGPNNIGLRLNLGGEASTSGNITPVSYLLFTVPFVKKIANKVSNTISNAIIDKSKSYVIRLY